MYLPLTDPRIREIRKDLTVKVYNPGEKEPVLVRAWGEDRKGYITLPRQYGLQLVEPFIDEELPSYWTLGYEPEVVLREGQGPWVDGIVKQAEAFGDVVAMAATGKGKTVMAVYAAMRLCVTTLIVVDQEFLRDQWIDCLERLYKVPKEDIGIIQGKTCDYEGRAFVVGMVQSMHSMSMDKHLSEYFGTIIYDECHTVGAPLFSRVMFKFNPAYRIAVSATPDRTDALHKILKWHLGAVSVKLEEKHDKSVVRFLEYDGVFSWYANISPKTGRFITELTEDGGRNALLADAIKWLYESGRDVLAVSDRIEHLENLMAYCSYLGIPEEDMGVVGGSYHVWGYAKDPKPQRKPQHLEKGAEYTPVIMQLKRKRTPRNVLQEIKDTRKVIFATYGMFTKGVNVPRLSGGIDCTPRSKAEQVHGRILRKMAGKLKPIWVTVRDVNSFRSQYQFSKRIPEYLKSNAEIYRWRIGKGVQRVDPRAVRIESEVAVQELKQRKIVTSPDGNNTILTKSTGRG